MQAVALVTLAFVALTSAAPTSDTQATCPNIISRSGWGARAPDHVTWLSVTPTPYTVIHHSESGSCSSVSSCSQLVRAFQNQHMDENGWADIGYNFLVGGDGNVYEGRGWDYSGAHSPNYNSKSIGICFIGSFMSSLPTSAALAAAKQLIDCGVTKSKISSGYTLIGHRQDISTDCPGNALYAHIQGWSHWEDV